MKWFLVWYVYKVPDPDNKQSPFLFGHSGGLWLFYSWFLVGIFGLGLAKYGLVGVEASMMMDKRWAANNAMQVMSTHFQVSFYCISGGTRHFHSLGIILTLVLSACRSLLEWAKWVDEGNT
jgi:hypothetical protein